MDRIFLIGNGASLKETNLNLLIGKPCMAVNKIHKIYPTGTEWRPTHYVKVDYSTFDPDNWMYEIMSHVTNGEQCLLWDAFRNGAELNDGNYEFIPAGIGDFPNVKYVTRCEHHYTRTAEWHKLCTGLNSIVTMAIWAVELGFDEIVLVGCDGLFSDPKTDHFDASYYNVVDATYASRNGENVLQAHDIISRFCPVPVYNATVGGILEMYPRVKLEDIVKET